MPNWTDDEGHNHFGRGDDAVIAPENCEFKAVVMVDELKSWPIDQAKPDHRKYFGEGKPSAHLTINGPTKELHEFAAMIGLKREWFQRDSTIPHYDLTPRQRELALSYGAKFIPAKEQAQGRVKRRKKREKDLDESDETHVSWKDVYEMEHDIRTKIETQHDALQSRLDVLFAERNLLLELVNAADYTLREFGDEYPGRLEWLRSTLDAWESRDSKTK